NATYAAVFGEHRPSRSAIAVKALPLGALVEIEAIAHLATS
ncbi:MAG: Rid family hydrolase, partial [Actinomycetota bacterium]|nr:Rid family hydrolase [Actinomycetota bacterium]